MASVPSPASVTRPPGGASRLAARAGRVGVLLALALATVTYKDVISEAQSRLK